MLHGNTTAPRDALNMVFKYFLLSGFGNNGGSLGSV